MIEQPLGLMGLAPNRGEKRAGVLGRSGNQRTLRPTKAASGFGATGIRLESGRPPSQNQAAYATTHRIFGCRCYSMVGDLAGIGEEIEGELDFSTCRSFSLRLCFGLHFLLYLRQHLLAEQIQLPGIGIS